MHISGLSGLREKRKYLVKMGATWGRKEKDANWEKEKQLKMGEKHREFMSTQSRIHFWCAGLMALPLPEGSSLTHHKAQVWLT